MFFFVLLHLSFIIAIATSVCKMLNVESSKKMTSCKCEVIISQDKIARLLGLQTNLSMIKKNYSIKLGKSQ